MNCFSDSQRRRQRLVVGLWQQDSPACWPSGRLLSGMSVTLDTRGSMGAFRRFFPQTHLESRLNSLQLRHLGTCNSVTKGFSGLRDRFW